MDAALEKDARRLASIASNAGIFCDFDGSLAPIVRDPEKARAIRGSARVLERLARRYATVAVVSGRPVKFLAKRLHPRKVQLVGLYGIEERVGRSLRVLPEVQAARQAVDRTAEQLRAELATDDGVYIEHKGLAVSVHFRRAKDPQAAQQKAAPIVDRVSNENGLAQLTRGKLVLEVAPPVKVSKGDVVRRLIQEKDLHGALVVGDDLGDLPTFEAVNGLDVAVRVAVGSDEAPPEIIAAADHVVPRPEDLVELLRFLVDASRP